jgi:hypothetical protein
MKHVTGKLAFLELYLSHKKPPRTTHDTSDGGEEVGDTGTLRKDNEREKEREGDRYRNMKNLTEGFFNFWGY